MACRIGATPFFRHETWVQARVRDEGAVNLYESVSDGVLALLEADLDLPIV